MGNHHEILFGLKFLPDRKGMISSSFVLFVWLYGHLVVFLPILVPHYRDGNISMETIAGYICLSFCTICCYFQAMFSDPGVVPRVTTEKIDWRLWEKCVRCGPRPPRSHHCRRCGYCVLGMDHHCQWINNCVGKNNLRVFYLLLVYASLFIALNIILYHFHKWNWFGDCMACNEVRWISPLANPIKSLSYLIAIPSFVAVTLLTILTGMHISIGMTTIEALEDPKGAMTRTLQYGSCFPKYDALSMLCGSRYPFLWMIPCTVRKPKEQSRPHII